MKMSNRRNFLKKVAVAATSAIVAPELLQAATKAESALSQTTAAQGAGNLIVPKEGGLRITGTFLDEISHDIPHQNWGAKEWEADFRHMKAIGIDTVIVIRSGYRKFITYPSPYLLKQGCYMPSVDLIDLFLRLAEKYGIDIMGFHILLDDEDIVEREKYTPEEFYDKMRAAKGIPSTAAITPIQFCEKYCQYVDEGYTDVIHVPINRSGSSTYNNAVMAQGMLREERPEHHLNIHLLDPHTYSMVFGWYLCEMARKLKNGAEISHVIREFEKQMDCMEIVLGPYSLKQMKKSGRISAAAAVMGELMGIRPIITLIDGKTRVESKVRGDDKVIPAMIDLCKKRTEGVEDFDYMIGHTSIPQAAELEKACRKAFGKAPLTTFNLGGVVSANTGPDTLALVYVGKPRD